MSEMHQYEEHPVRLTAFPIDAQTHILTLEHYIRAMEAGDIDALSAILSQAEQDPILERLLLEMNQVYLQEDQPTQSQSADEIVRMQDFLHNHSNALFSPPANA